jgi:hypothetical protein
MQRRPDWNRKGYRLPAWFRLRLRRIDHRLCLQFFPPNTLDPEGVPAGTFPHGVWYICSRIRGSGRWLAKRAVFVLTDQAGRPAAPTHELVRLLKEARNLRRRGDLEALERRFEQYLVELERERVSASRTRLLSSIIDPMRKRGMRSFANPRVFVPAPAMT